MIHDYRCRLVLPAVHQTGISKVTLHCSSLKLSVSFSVSISDLSCLSTLPATPKQLCMWRHVQLVTQLFVQVQEQ